MPAPFPYDGIAGIANDPAESEAANLHANYKWLARLADEMDAEVELDLKRVMQLVTHCRKFRLWYEALQARGPAAMDQVDGFFAMKKCRWASRADMLADLGDLYAASGTIADWIEANAAEYKSGFSTVRVLATAADGTPTVTDDPVKGTKTPQIAARLTNFRSRFGAKPAG